MPVFKIVAFFSAVLLAMCMTPLVSAHESEDEVDTGSAPSVDGPALSVIGAAFRNQYPSWPNRELQSLIDRPSANFEVEAWLLSAGMYGEAPMAPAAAFAQYAPRFAQERNGDVTSVALDMEHGHAPFSSAPLRQISGE